MNSYDEKELYDKEPNIEAIMDKHSIARHDLVFVASAVTRALQCTPKSALLTIEAIDDLEEYLISLRFKETG